MANIGERHCIRFKNVQTGGASRRVCAKYGEVSEDSAEHSGMFGDLGKLIPKALGGSKDELIGVGIGLLGVAGVKLAAAQFPDLISKVPAILLKGLPALGGALAGVVSYGVTRNKGYALGALGAGVALNAWDLLSSQFPSLGTLVTYSIPGYGGYGMLQPEVMQRGQPGQYGHYAALIDDPRPGMSELAAMSMGDEEDAAP